MKLACCIYTTASIYQPFCRITIAIRDNLQNSSLSRMHRDNELLAVIQKQKTAGAISGRGEKEKRRK
jgi:hypothetical protein